MHQTPRASRVLSAPPGPSFVPLPCLPYLDRARSPPPLSRSMISVGMLAGRCHPILAGWRSLPSPKWRSKWHSGVDFADSGVSKQPGANANLADQVCASLLLPGLLNAKRYTATFHIPHVAAADLCILSAACECGGCRLKYIIIRRHPLK